MIIFIKDVFLALNGCFFLYVDYTFSISEPRKKLMTVINEN